MIDRQRGTGLSGDPDTRRKLPENGSFGMQSCLNQGVKVVKCKEGKKRKRISAYVSNHDDVIELQ